MKTTWIVLALVLTGCSDVTAPVAERCPEVRFFVDSAEVVNLYPEGSVDLVGQGIVLRPGECVTIRGVSDHD